MTLIRFEFSAKKIQRNFLYSRRVYQYLEPIELYSKICKIYFEKFSYSFSSFRIDRERFHKTNVF